jgi:U32 family peptidase
MSSPASKPELLAPAGDWEALKAAVANGADAVYFGLTAFNARHRAHNFEPSESPEVMTYLHCRGVKGYVTFNTLIFANELPRALEMLAAVRDANADAVIVQDLGLAWAIQQLLPGLAVHGSTQMTLTEPLAVNRVKTLGVERVILARELSVADVGKVHQASNMPLEVFIHGALCVAYSGQCLTSEALGGRSANRGQCAQACRLPYELLVDGQPRDLGDKAYLLSPQDLAAYDLVGDLVKNGVVSFKIEGRLKKADYVAATVQTYRKAIDSFADRGQVKPLEKRDRLDLEQTFSRGLTNGFLGGIDHQTLVPGRSPKKRGVRIGTVVGASRRGVLVERADIDTPLEWLIKPGDGVVFDEGRPEEDEAGGRVWQVNEPKLDGRIDVVELLFEREALDLQSIPTGALVWKTDDPALRKRLAKSYAQEKPALKEPLRAHLEGEVGSPLQLTLTVNGLKGRATWPGPLEVARSQPTGIDVIREQLGRLHETPYELSDITLALAAGVMLPKSVLNQLRRDALDDLQRQASLTVKSASEIPIGDRLEKWRANLKRDNIPPDLPAEPQLHVLVRTMDQLQAVLDWSAKQPADRPDTVYCDFEDVRRYRDAIALCRAAGQRLGVATLRIIKPGEESWLRLIASYEPDIILARNLGSVVYYQQHAPHILLVGDFSLNVVNDLTAHWFAGQGLRRMVPGFDLNWEQLKALLQHAHPGWFEVVVHYHMPMFHNEHCVFASLLSTGKDWRDCGRPCDRHQVTLRDRAGAVFPVVADAGCRNTVYNALPQSAAEFLPAMVKLGVRHFRIELLRENAGQIATVLDNYRRVLRGDDDGKAAWKKLQATNQLGVTRGTLQMV